MVYFWHAKAREPSILSTTLISSSTFWKDFRKWTLKVLGYLGLEKQAFLVATLKNCNYLHCVCGHRTWVVGCMYVLYLCLLVGLYLWTTSIPVYLWSVFPTGWNSVFFELHSQLRVSILNVHWLWMDRALVSSWCVVLNNLCSLRYLLPCHFHFFHCVRLQTNHNHCCCL